MTIGQVLGQLREGRDKDERHRRHRRRRLVGGGLDAGTPQRITIEQALAQLKGDDKEQRNQAMQVIVEIFTPGLARAWVPDGLDAWREDFIQDTFVAAAKNIRKFRGRSEGEFFVWLRGLHRDQLKTPRRRLQRLPAILRKLANTGDFGPADRGPLPEEQVPQHDDLLRALARLPEHLREVLLAYYGEDLSCAEIAEIMDRPEGTVKGWLHKARERLRAELSRFPDVGSPP